MSSTKTKINKQENFLSLENLTKSSLQNILWQAFQFKKLGKAASSTYSNNKLPLEKKLFALLFTKNSTRTRLAFERSIIALGGNVTFLSAGNIQLSRGEPLEDTLRVLASYTDGIVVRMGSHQLLEEASIHSSVPVINALTDYCHPTEALADALTMAEVLLQELSEKQASAINNASNFANLLSSKNVSGRAVKAAYVGDANNVARSFALVCHMLGMQCCIATPEGSSFPKLSSALKNSACVSFTTNPSTAAKNAKFIYTDTWVSMGNEKEKQRQRAKLAKYAVNKELVSLAQKNYVFMHCLPAYRGEEVSAEIIDGPHSYVFAQSENRMHTVKALLQHLYS